MLFTKIYIITSPELMQAVQRNRALRLDPLLDLSVRNMCGITDKKVLGLLLDTSSGGEGLVQRVMHALAPRLVGQSLDQINMRMVRRMTPLMDEMGDKSSFDLYRWCQDAITTASTDAIYGPMNPFKDSIIADAFW